MAKTTSFTGGASSDPEAVANWDNGVPVATDTAIILADANNPFIPTASWAAFKLAKFYISTGYPFNVGAPGNPLIAQATEVIHRGSGALYYEGATGATDSMIINSDKIGPIAAFISNTSGEITRVVIVKGHVVLGPPLGTINRLEISYRNNPLTDAFVDGSQDGGATTLIMVAGQLVSGEGFVNVKMSGGVFTRLDAGGFTTLDLSGGTLFYNSRNNITTAHILGGTLDFTDNPFEHIVTNLYRYPDGEVLRSSLTTVTNEFDMTGGD